MTPPSLTALLEQLAAAGIEVPPGRVVLDSFGDSAELSRELVGLIRAGRKRAGTSLLWAYAHEGEALPEVGDVGVVLDHEGAPRAVTRVVDVRVVAFDAVDAAYAALEGEGDGSLAHWRTVHWDVFGRECARIGRVPTLDMPVVCCAFELVAVVPDPGVDPAA
ncbi:MAG: ASCH domain-containing protein [Trueperaceae bacterium]